jgi:oxygen-dependent protoporphyrinogen oxidase
VGRIVVVGGGITGLSAAWELRDLEGEVVVLEASDTFGGILRTSDLAGRPLDEAADSLLARVPWGIELCQELGLGDQLVAPASRNAYVWHDGALRPFPEGHVLGVPTDLDAAVASGVLDAADRARAEQDLRGEAPPLEGDRTIGSVIRERLGDAVADRLVDPLVGGINAGSIDELSIDAVTAQLAAPARADRSLIRALRAVREAHPPVPNAPVFQGHPQGMGQIVRVLALKLLTAGVELRTGVTVAGIEPAPAGGWLLHAEDEVIPADQVILAVPAARAAALLSDHVTGDEVAWLGQVEHASVAMVALALADDALGRPLDGSGYLIPRAARTTVTAVSWSSSKWAHLAGVGDGEDGTHLLRASVGRAGDEGVVLELDDEDLLARVLTDLEATMELEGEPADVRVSRWPASLPQYAPGHLDRVAVLEAAVRRDAPGVHLAGAAYRGLGVPACIHQGREAAARAKAVEGDRMVR